MACQRPPILRLPAELRNRIWEQALDCLPAEDQRTKNIYDEPLPLWCSSPPINLLTDEGPALTQVNKQIRAETLEMSYSYSNFTVRLSPANIDTFYAALKAMGPEKLGRISELRIELCGLKFAHEIQKNLVKCLVWFGFDDKRIPWRLHTRGMQRFRGPWWQAQMKHVIALEKRHQAWKKSPAYQARRAARRAAWEESLRSGDVASFLSQHS